MMGLQVKADYVPLLQSLATYGWRLTCVLPTPVIKTNSDGSLSTKQIVFLQRPVLGRKRRESKKLIFKPRSKSNKNCIKDTAKNKKKKKTKGEKDAEDPKIIDDGEKAEREEEKSREEGEEGEEGEDPAYGDEVRESGTLEERESRCEEDGKIDDGIEINVETVELKDGGTETKDKGAGNVSEEEGEEEKITLNGEGSEENGEAETVATVETENETKEHEDTGAAEVEAVMENGVEADGERDEGEEEEAIERKAEEPAGVEVSAKEIVADSLTNQSPEETQE